MSKEAEKFIEKYTTKNQNDWLVEKKDIIAKFMESYYEEKTNSSEIEIYGTCDDEQGEVYALFDNKERCETEAEECGCEVKTLTLYRGKRH